MSRETDPPSPATSQDRLCLLLLLLAVAPVYGYFFQGRGDVQTSHFDTVRALVERGTFEITPYLANPVVGSTGDISIFDDRTYSNQPPGLAVLGAAVYAPLHAVEVRLGASPDDPDTWHFNQYVVALGCSALPGILTIAVLFVLFRREAMTAATAALLAGSFAFGTLLLPYAGTLMMHNLGALCIAGPWAMLTGNRRSSLHDLLAGLVLGIGATTNYLAIPVIPLFLAFVWWDRRTLKPLLWLSIFPLAAIAGLMVFHAALFGSALATSHAHQPAGMNQPGLFMGVFDWPEWRRVYWLTFHPFRGLFYYCPILLLGVLGAVYRARSGMGARWVLPLAIVVLFFMFNLCFAGWTGGWCVGPRYLIPAMPMLFLFAPSAVRRHRRISGVLIALSVLNMLAVTSVRVIFPAPSFGAPPAPTDSFSNPIGECLRRWTFDQVARQVGSFNLGMLAGLEGVSSIVPVILIIVAFYGVLLGWRLRQGRERADMAPAAAE
jgi:hypothetical protein